MEKKCGSCGSGGEKHSPTESPVQDAQRAPCRTHRELQTGPGRQGVGWQSSQPQEGPGVRVGTVWMKGVTEMEMAREKPYPASPWIAWMPAPPMWAGCCRVNIFKISLNAIPSILYFLSCLPFPLLRQLLDHRECLSQTMVIAVGKKYGRNVV